MASFIGLPPMNFFNVRVNGATLEGALFTQKLTEAESQLLAAYQGKEVVLGVRPEDIETGGDIDVQVFSNENLGMNTLVHGRLAGSNTQDAQITCKLRGWCDYKKSDSVNVSFVRCHYFDKETTNAIR